MKAVFTSPDDAWRTPGVAHKSPQQTLGFLQLCAIGVDQTAPLGVQPPPALEAPDALIGDPEPRDARAGPARLPGLKIEKTLEGRGLTGPVRLALPAVEKDQTGRTRTDLVRDARRPANPSRSSVGARVTSRRTPWIA